MPEQMPSSLPQQISKHFNLDELRVLCFDLSIDYEDVRGETKIAKALGLVEYCQKENKISQLIELCYEKRPFLTWTHRQPPHASIHQRYCQHLIARYQYLDFRGMGQTGQRPIRLPLETVYVPLNGRINKHLWNSNQAENSQPAPVHSLLTLLQNNAGLILLGAPGSGKTAWLKYLTLQLARGNGKQLGLGDKIPLLLSLSAYATALAEKDMSLTQFLADFYQNLGFAPSINSMVQEALADGNAVLLLDGLDEVASPDSRHLLVNRLIDFYTIQQPNGNKFVITSRPAGYEAVRLLADGLLECTITPLDTAQIETFISQWTAAFAQQSAAENSSATAVAEQNRLRALLAEKTAVQELVRLPLLLTVLLLTLRQDVSPPQWRVTLYDLYLRTLLHQWQTARSLDRPPSRQLESSQMIQLLAPMALWMHEASPQHSTAGSRQLPYGNSSLPN